MAGSTSWIDTYLAVPTPCAPNSQSPTTFSSCIVWLMLGLMLGGLTFQKKGSQQ